MQAYKGGDGRRRKTMVIESLSNSNGNGRRRRMVIEEGEGEW